MPEECFNLSTVTSVWVSDACFKPYTQPRNFNKTVAVSDGCAQDLPNLRFDKRN